MFFSAHLILCKVLISGDFPRQPVANSLIQNLPPLYNKTGTENKLANGGPLPALVLYHKGAELYEIKRPCFLSKYRLNSGVFFQAFLAEFNADAGAFDAAKGDVRLDHAVLVDPDTAAFKATGQGLGLRDIIAPD